MLFLVLIFKLNCRGIKGLSAMKFETDVELMVNCFTYTLMVWEKIVQLWKGQYGKHWILCKKGKRKEFFKKHEATYWLNIATKNTLLLHIWRHHCVKLVGHHLTSLVKKNFLLHLVPSSDFQFTYCNFLIVTVGCSEIYVVWKSEWNIQLLCKSIERPKSS